ncbi:diaminopimelate decarboxylase [Ferroplasma acidiphilum]|jgi:diaminopimelate decarboxylase|uniref:Diaminopimelate decarboxylase n=2 Tax=Ferroplasma TaxID=74968 RepID=S0ARN7_FERAC|nr:MULTISPECIES: diaminopimelate decarboxylase [Ferroplasma]AGO61641.1 diaminopimelate decarboxylase [Ferroplasma acidarmanus Fer1]ARD84548.1 diaminopimelate decarboxylase [Ferroplasma acidiphilum]
MVNIKKLYPGLSPDVSEFAGKSIKNISDAYGTPVIVYNMARVRENIRRIRDAFNGINIKVHFAVKSNYNPYIVSQIIKEGTGIDAANYNEVKLAIMCGLGSRDIIATPNNLSGTELRTIKEEGVAINFDHEGQMGLLKGSLPETVSFRINPGIGKGEFPGITTGGKNVKFGISVDDAISAYSAAIKAGVKHFGIHMMTGSNVLEPEFFNESSGLFFKIAETISDRTGIDFDFIDIGGGFGVPYTSDEHALDIGKTAGYISDNFRASNNRGYFKDSRLIIEPGRYIVADSAILLSKVTSIKHSDRELIGIDASMNTLIRIPLYGARHGILLSGHGENTSSSRFDIVGQVCENTDYIAKDISIPEPAVGDIVVIADAGAYVASMASNYNLLSRPAELVLEGDREILTKGHDGLESMLAGYKMS